MQPPPYSAQPIPAPRPTPAPTHVRQATEKTVSGQPVPVTSSAEQKDFESKLSTQPRELQDAYKTGGFEAYNKAVEVYNKTAATQVSEFEAKLSTQPRELQDAYKTGGFEGYNRAVELFNERVQADYTRRAELARQTTPVSLDPALFVRERELVDAIAFSERVKSGEINLSQIGMSSEEYWKSVEDVKAKLEVINQAKRVSTGELVVESPQAYEQYVRAATSPFATHTTEGLRIDTVAAVKAGTTVAALKSWGLTDKDIDVAKTQIALSKIPDLAQAVREGKIELVRKAQEYGLLTSEQVVDIQLGAAEIPIREAEIKTMPQELREAYQKEGVEGYYKALTDYNKKIEQEEAKRSAALTKLESKGYHMTKEQLGQLVMTTFGDTTKHYSDRYDIVGFLRDAIEKDLSTTLMKPPTPKEKVWNVDKGIWEESKITHIPSLEERLSEYSPNYQEALATLKDAGFTDKIINAAKTTATTTTGATIGPTTSERPSSFQIGAERVGLSLENWLTEKDKEFREELSMRGPVAGVIAGAGMALLTAVVSIPMLVATIGKDPSKTPTVLVGSVKDMAKSLTTNVLTLAAGGYKSPYDLALNTTTSVIIVAGVVGPIKGAIGKITTYISPRGVNLSAIAKELSTGRLAVREGLEQAMVDALTEVERMAMRTDSPFTGEVPIGNTGLKFKYLKTPINQVVGGVRWHGAQDGLAFIKDQIEVTLSDGKRAFKVKVPVNTEITPQLLKLTKFSNESIAAIDTPQIRALRLADAADIPVEIANLLQDYVRANSGKIYGSFVDWLKRKDAVQPNDVDIVFKTVKDAEAARNYVSREAQSRGFQTRVNDRGVQILKDGEWVTITNIVDEASHAKMMSPGKYAEYTVMSNEGILTTTTGTQFVNQALGTLKPSAKAAIRAEKVIKAAPEIIEVAKVQGIKPQAGVSEFTVGEKGLYTTPWAAMQYTRGVVTITAENIMSFPGTKIGDIVRSKPALLMVLEDSGQVKTGKVGELTQSDRFITGKKGETYGPTKHYKGDLETEVVDSPETVVRVPDPKADLVTRNLAGSFADFFTYDDGKFVPIKIGVKKGGRIPTIAELYTTKLLTLENALRDTFKALKHPVEMIQDITRSLEALKDVDPLYGSSGGATTFPGVRDVYLEGTWRVKFQNTLDKLLKRTTEDVSAKAAMEGISKNTTTYQNLLRDGMKDAYEANARSLISTYGSVTGAYTASVGARTYSRQLILLV